MWLIWGNYKEFGKAETKINSVGSMGHKQDQMIEARLNVLSCTVRGFNLYSKRDLDLT